MLLALGVLSGASRAQRNVLVLVADDLGVDMLSVYAEGSDFPTTPNIDWLADTGILFRNAWSNPLCSPTRATLMTGRYAARTGIGFLVGGNDFSLANSGPFTLPEMLTLGSDTTHGMFGKWHLSTDAGGWPHAPNDSGWDWFEGVKANLVLPETYSSYEWYVNGVPEPSSTYITTKTVDAALAWISGVSRPWLAFVSFNAPHTPQHVPPDGLHTVDLTQAPPLGEDPRPYYKANIEAMDFEIGRLLASIPDLSNTVVIFLGDNGTPGGLVIPPWSQNKAKGTIFEGGINVPMILAEPAGAFLDPGPGPTEVDALVTTTDLFATVAEIAGVDLDSLFISFGGYADFPTVTRLVGGYRSDSVSFLPYLDDPGRPPLRRFAYAEIFQPNGFGPYAARTRAARDERFKLVVSQGTSLPPFALYDLDEDPFETANLLELHSLSPPVKSHFTDLLRFFEQL